MARVPSDDRDDKHATAMIEARRALIVWTPRHAKRRTAGQIRVGPLCGAAERDGSLDFTMSGGAPYRERREATGRMALAFLLADFHTIVLRDGLSPNAVHRALLGIKEYRRAFGDLIPDDDDDSRNRLP